MRTAWMMQAWHSKQRGGCISPYEMLKIATVNGAKTLGRNDLGSLEPEKGADLFMVDAGVLELTGTLHDPRNLLAPHRRHRKCVADHGQRPGGFPGRASDPGGRREIGPGGRGRVHQGAAGALRGLPQFGLSIAWFHGI